MQLSVGSIGIFFFYFLLARFSSFSGHLINLTPGRIRFSCPKSTALLIKKKKQIN